MQGRATHRVVAAQAATGTVLASAPLTLATLVLALIVPAAHVQVAQAQVVRGRLVESSGDSALATPPAPGRAAGVGGAMVTLVDDNDRALAQVLTRSGSGLFEIAAPSPGEYRVRADRIGYATTYSHVFRLTPTDTVLLRIEAPVEPISLEGVEAEADRLCRVRPEENLAVARVWEEARKALAAAAWTQGRGLYRYEMMTVRRDLDTKGRRVLAEDRAFDTAFQEEPFGARSADSLAAEGYAQLSADEAVFWAPDANVFLSDSFLDQHCFRVVRDNDEAPGLIGLAFEPVQGRKVPEISGTMWLDPSTARLQRLDFLYENLNVPRTLLEASPGGRVQFLALPDGTWIVYSWRIRMFRAGRRERRTGRLVSVLDGITEQGGEVLRVHGSEGVVFEAGPGRRIVGVVRDSLGAGLPNARVFVPGEGMEAQTGPDGAFELTRVQPGVYPVAFTHPYLERFSWESEPVEVEVKADADGPNAVEFTAPSATRLIERICDDVRPSSTLLIHGQRPVLPNGILTGFVTDSNGRPLPKAVVRVLSRAQDAEIAIDDFIARRSDAERTEGMAGTVAQTSSDGFYRACWMPSGVPLHVAVLDPVGRLEPGAEEVGENYANVAVLVDTTFTIPAKDPAARLDLRVGMSLPSL